MIFERMRNYCIYRIACTTNLLFFFFFAMMFINPNQISGVKARGSHLSNATCLTLVFFKSDE